jgi:hypothetical protein
VNPNSKGAIMPQRGSNFIFMLGGSGFQVEL